MHSKMKKEYSVEKEVICEMLRNMSLTEFTFHTSFELKFSRCKNTEFKGKHLPEEIKFAILTDWWFGSKEEWGNKVKQLTAGLNLIEPDEPVLSYELTCLRWTEGSEVDSILFEDENMKIMFKCGKSISVSYYNEMDYSWVISECNTSDSSNRWNVVCEDGEFFVSIPQ